MMTFWKNIISKLLKCWQKRFVSYNWKWRNQWPLPNLGSFLARKFKLQYFGWFSTTLKIRLENHSNQSHDFLKLISYFLIGKPAKNSLVGRVLKNSNYKQGQKYFVEWWLRLHHQRWFYNGMRQKTAQDTIRI